jgi:hypothetical protein
MESHSSHKEVSKTHNDNNLGQGFNMFLVILPHLLDAGLAQWASLCELATLPVATKSDTQVVNISLPMLSVLGGAQWSKPDVTPCILSLVSGTLGHVVRLASTQAFC